MFKTDRLHGISPIISVVILIAVIFSIAAVIGPWMYDIAKSTTNQTGTDINTQLTCQNTAYDFDTDYAIFGINWSESNNKLTAKITNTGTINLYNFSFEILLNSTVIKYFNVNTDTQKTKANPLKPGQTAILEADNTTSLIGSTLNEVKILNEVCPSVYINQEI